jgi:hypothetical protein
MVMTAELASTTVLPSAGCDWHSPDQPPAGAGLVLDDHGLPEFLAQLVANQPRGQVGGAAGG